MAKIKYSTLVAEKPDTAKAINAALGVPVNVKHYGAVGDGVTDDTVAIQAAINAGGKVIGNKGESYLIRDMIEIVDKDSVEFDLNGATIIDDVQGLWAARGDSARPLFFINTSQNITIRNFNYESTVTRENALVHGIIVIGITVVDYVWNDSNDRAVKNILIENINASNLSTNSVFVGVLGNVLNCKVRNINIYGNCKYGINVEYGLKAEETYTGNLAGIEPYYGLHPYNISIENFNGYDNAESTGFLRVASVYNVSLKNCYGYNVKNFIYCWAGDRHISRVSQTVIFENCASYMSSDTSYSENSISLVSNTIDGSTSEALPVWTNYDHSYIFNNCQIQGTPLTSGARIALVSESVTFNNCIIRNCLTGANIAPSASAASSKAENCIQFNHSKFINNNKDLTIVAMEGILFNHCNFKNNKGLQIPITITDVSNYNRFDNCKFGGMLGAFAYISISANSLFNKITNCVFDNPGAANIESLARTYGSNNETTGTLVNAGVTFFGLIGQPETQQYNLTNLTGVVLNGYHKTDYYAAVSMTKSIESISSYKIGTVIKVSATSAGASITFVHAAAGASTTNRILTSTGADVVKTGGFWMVYLVSTPYGFHLIE